jgi:hypothetical protein
MNTEPDSISFSARDGETANRGSDGRPKEPSSARVQERSLAMDQVRWKQRAISFRKPWGAAGRLPDPNIAPPCTA